MRSYTVAVAGLSATARLVGAAVINAGMPKDIGTQGMDHGYSCAFVWITAGVLVGLLVGTTSYKLKIMHSNERNDNGKEILRALH
ncbi:hypothetical protein H4R99_001849 [Coemansia sp. RSA 1722]|nr:hypothetical protein LPJ57_001891 [Coemansia sp. RSA 486]KAJ2604374.1 hypothetical protein H4R99_001849 [Coemansia sp. RSA 1722]